MCVCVCVCVCWGRVAAACVYVTWNMLILCCILYRFFPTISYINFFHAFSFLISLLAVLGLCVAAWRLSLAVPSGARSLVWCTAFPLRWLLSCGAQARGSPAAAVVACTGSGVQAPWLGRVSLIAPWHVESSWTRDQPCVSWVGSRIFNHWTTREVLLSLKNENNCYLFLTVLL